MIPVVEAYAVHQYVDSRIEYRADSGEPNKWLDLINKDRHDEWRDDIPKYGDCDDYAMSKRRMLLEKGYGAKDMRITLVAYNGSFLVNHMILQVKTERGWYGFDIGSFYKFTPAPNNLMLVEGTWRQPRTRDSEPSKYIAANPQEWRDFCALKDKTNAYDHDCYAAKPAGSVSIEFLRR